MLTKLTEEKEMNLATFDSQIKKLKSENSILKAKFTQSEEEYKQQYENRVEELTNERDQLEEENQDLAANVE